MRSAMSCRRNLNGKRRCGNLLHHGNTLGIGIKRIAQAAWQVNETTENIGARRLHTVLERLVEDISYDASEMNGQTVTIDAEYVSKHLDVLVADEDLSRFIL